MFPRGGCARKCKDIPVIKIIAQLYLAKAAYLTPFFLLLHFFCRATCFG